MKNFLVAVAAALSLVAFAAYAAPKIPKAGEQLMPVERYGSASSATTGAAALVFSVPGLKAGTSCVASVASFGTGPVALRGPVVATADTLTATMDANQSGGATVINYVCFKS
jgi:hypothetical protein